MASAARHPGMFAAAASYSGLLHSRYQGDPRCHGDRWAAHNPSDLAPGCAASACSCRSSAAGPARSTDLGYWQGQQIEQALRPQSLAFVERLRQLGIPLRFNAYDPGNPRLALLAAGAAPVAAAAAGRPQDRRQASRLATQPAGLWRYRIRSISWRIRSSDRGLRQYTSQAFSTSPMPQRNSGNAGQKKSAPVNAQVPIREEFTTR
jgi:hypothetical protein